MAGRPLKGSLWQRGRKWVVTLPLEQGSRLRVTTSFASKQDAERWRTAAIAAVSEGLPLPDAAPFRSAASPRRMDLSTLADVAMDWYRENYENPVQDLPSPKRCERVRHDLTHHLIPYFAARTDKVSDITRDMVREWLD